MPAGKRLRGWLLRLVLSRPVALCSGSLLVAPAAWVSFTDQPWESPLTDGLSLIVGATGVALLLAGLSGRRSDWIEPTED